MAGAAVGAAAATGAATAAGTAGRTMIGATVAAAVTATAAGASPAVSVTAVTGGSGARRQAATPTRAAPKMMPAVLEASGRTTPAHRGESVGRATARPRGREPNIRAKADKCR